MSVSFWSDLILELRKEKGWTQNKVAQTAGLSRLTLQRIETGQSPGTVVAIEKILGVFGYELEAIQIKEAVKRDEKTLEEQAIRSRRAKASLLGLKPLKHL